MVINVGERDGFGVLEVRGRLNMNSDDEFREAVTRAMGTGQFHLLVDLGATESVDSTGLGALVWAATRLRRDGGDLRLVNANEYVKMLLQRTNLTKMLPIVEEPGPEGG